MPVHNLFTKSIQFAQESKDIQEFLYKIKEQLGYIRTVDIEHIFSHFPDPCGAAGLSTFYEKYRKRLKTCEGCRAFITEENTPQPECRLKYKFTDAVVRGFWTYIPLEKCPKPKTYASVLEHFGERL